MLTRNRRKKRDTSLPSKGLAIVPVRCRYFVRKNVNNVDPEMNASVPGTDLSFEKGHLKLEPNFLPTISAKPSPTAI